MPLNTQRRDAVLAALRGRSAPSTVIDLGCGRGQLLAALLAEEPRRTGSPGSTSPPRSLRAGRPRRCALETMGERQAERIKLFQGALTYEDPRFAGYDAAVLMEVVEHVDPPRLRRARARRLRSRRAPARSLVTTPNAEYNVRYEALVGPAAPRPPLRVDARRVRRLGRARSRAAYGYTVELRGIGERRPRARARRPSWGCSAVAEIRRSVPRMGLVLLVGVSGSGKSTFAARHFLPTQVLSSDSCRGLVADDENDQAATRGRLRRAALHRRHPAAARAADRRRRDQRAGAARGLSLIAAGQGARRAGRRDRPRRARAGRARAQPAARRTATFGAHVVARQHRDLDASLRGIRKEGFRRVHVLDGVEEIDAAPSSPSGPGTTSAT